MSDVDARAFATWLATIDDDALEQLLRDRRVSPSVSWTDYFDAAEALLDPAALTRAAGLLSRGEVDALTSAVASGTAVTPGPERAGLLAAGLVTPAGEPYEAVVSALPSIARNAAAATADSPAESDEQLAERAFAAVASLADILHLTGPAPLTRTGSGSLIAGDRRRLLEAGAVTDPDAADDLIALASDAGLLRSGVRDWRVTDAGAAWLLTGTVARWTVVAERLRAALPAHLRTAGGGWIPVSDWVDAHPLDPQWPQRAAGIREQWHRWAILDGTGRTAGWATALAQGGDVDSARLQELLPGEVDRIYLQNDLTAIAPGPLQPAIDARLRRVARRESRAQASTYRFSAESIGAALAAGEDAAALAAFLREISLSGLPQPLAYELERAATRYGELRVGTDATGRTEVRATDRALLDTLVVDQSLRPLGLVSDGERLVTRSSVDSVFWMLADARYPAVAVDAEGVPRSLERTRLADEVAAPAASDHRELVARLRSAHGGDADSAWLGRELERAVRGRAQLEVTVSLPDGSTRVFLLEASGLGGGRLRGRDRAADVERTLPLANITGVRVL